jgi:hypothetical protein
MMKYREGHALADEPDQDDQVLEPGDSYGNMDPLTREDLERLEPNLDDLIWKRTN